MQHFLAILVSSPVTWRSCSAFWRCHSRERQLHGENEASTLLLKAEFYFYGCTGSSLLHTGFSLVVVPGLLIVVACLFTDHRLKGMPASVVVVHGLSSYGSPPLEHWLNSCGMRLSCPVAYGIILDWGWNLCLLHWQVNSYLLLYHGSPEKAFLILNDGRLHQNLFFV